jgi:nucleotide-binding universal stress UspA family protein
MTELTFHPLGIALAATFLVSLLALFRWMFAAPPPAPLQVINVRQTVSNLNRILVPLVESIASERAVELACRLSSDRKGEIILASVIVVPLALSLETPLPALEEEAHRTLETGAFIVKQHKLKSEERIVRHRNAAEGILRLAREMNADVIVMGAGIPQHRNFLVVSPTVTELLRRAPMEVIVAKAPIPA